MAENQEIEYKKIWKDEWLEWICGMANTTGGILYIGLDDNGKVVGLGDSANSLFDKLPGKIKDSLGIIPKVKLKDEDGKSFIEIDVEKYPVLISYNGKYYLRSGRSNHTATTAEIQRITLSRVGKTWDSMPIPNVTVDDLDEESIKVFKDLAVKNKRLTPEEVSVDNETLLKNLQLFDGNYLTIAAILLFHSHPENWVTGAYTKIGYFKKNDADLIYQDEIKGSLIMQAIKVDEVVYTKYMKGLITYENQRRIDEYMFSRSAFRELLYNSLQHKLYSSGNPIQISIYDDKFYIFNSGELPDNLKDDLYAKHFSTPYNPKIAQVFFKAGFTESWGRGFTEIKESCKQYECPLPELYMDKGGTMILCKASERYLKLLNTIGEESNRAQDRAQDKAQDEMIIEFCLEPKDLKEIAEYFGYKNVRKFRENHINPLLNTGKLKMTIPNKPTSRNQKYISNKSK